MVKSNSKGHFKLSLIKTNETEPFKVIEFNNLVVTAGSNFLQDTFIGLESTPFTLENTLIGSGDDDTAPDVAQTDLQAAVNKVRVVCTAVSRTDDVVTWTALFDVGDANWVWKEVGLFNVDDVMFCRGLVEEPFAKDSSFSVQVEYNWTHTYE